MLLSRKREKEEILSEREEKEREKKVLREILISRLRQVRKKLHLTLHRKRNIIT